MALFFINAVRQFRIGIRSSVVMMASLLEQLKEFFTVG
jgi:hypothetical protein